MKVELTWLRGRRAGRSKIGSVNTSSNIIGTEEDCLKLTDQENKAGIHISRMEKGKQR